MAIAASSPSGRRPRAIERIAGTSKRDQTSRWASARTIRKDGAVRRFGMTSPRLAQARQACSWGHRAQPDRVSEPSDAFNRATKKEARVGESATILYV